MVCRTIIFVSYLYTSIFIFIIRETIRFICILLTTTTTTTRKKYYFRWQKCFFLVLFCLRTKRKGKSFKNNKKEKNTHTLRVYGELQFFFLVWVYRMYIADLRYTIVSGNPFVFLFLFKKLLVYIDRYMPPFERKKVT